MFIELPDSGTGECKMKIGDGISTYSNLPYAMEYKNHWEGTKAQWDALTNEEKALWTGKYVIITDDDIGPDVNNTNPNLLDNPWFTINQREFTSSNHVDYEYTYDRWKIIVDYMGTVNATNDGMEIDTTSNPITIAQYSEVNKIVNKIINSIVTVSIDFTVEEITDTTGSLYWLTNTDVIAGNLKEIFEVKFSDMIVGQRYYITKTFDFNDLNYDFSLMTWFTPIWIYMKTGAKIKIHSVKLEMGSVSTLKNDLPPNYQQELLKCQRYFIAIKAKSNMNSWVSVGLGYISGSNIYGEFTFYAPPMFRTPTITYNNIQLTTGDKIMTITEIRFVHSVDDNSIIHIPVTAAKDSSLTQTYLPIGLRFVQNSSYLYLSAEL